LIIDWLPLMGIDPGLQIAIANLPQPQPATTTANPEVKEILPIKGSPN
jgi:hypothetical protein